LEDGGHILFTEEEVAVLHESEALGVETPATILATGFRIDFIWVEARERFAIGIFVEVCGEVGLDGLSRILLVGKKEDGIEAGSEVDGAIAGTAIGGEVEGF
jgi:hypothetical protein